MIEILNRYTKAVIYRSETATSVGEAIGQAAGSRADLSSANLSRADLSFANLLGANLLGAKGINANRCTPLRILLAQTGTLRAWKLVTKNGEGPYAKSNGYVPILYEVGKEYESVADTDESKDCAAGISLATLDWVMKEWRDGYRVLLVEFDRKDLACIPTGTDGKFRVHRCRVIEECDLKEIGLVEEKVEASK